MRLLDVTKIIILNRISNSLKLFLSSRLIKKNFKTVTLYSNIIYTHRNIFQHIADVCQTSTLNFIQLLKQAAAEDIEKEKDIPLSKDSFYIDILKKHESLINRICLYYASSKDEYEDLRQDTLINIWRGIPKYKEDCKISTWIYRICLNTCVTSWRKSKKRFNFDSLDSITEFADDSETDNEKIEQLHYFISISCVAVAFIVFCPMWIRLINQPTLNITLTAIMVLYFTTASIMDYWLYRRVSEIDIFTMKVKTVTEIAKTCKKRHHQFMMILIPLCILTLGLMAYCVIDEPYVLIGMITGGAIGLAIGCQKYFDFMKDYHTLSDNDND